jgi:hypothetical protein
VLRYDELAAKEVANCSVDNWSDCASTSLNKLRWYFF